MTTTMLTSLFALMSTFVAPEASADGPETRRHHKGHGMCAKLECSDEQRTEIKAVRAEHKAEMADARAKAKEIKAALHAERGSPDANPERVAELRAELDAIKAELRQAREETRTEVGALLTPEQRAALAEMRAERKARKGKRGGKGKGKARKGKRGGKDKVHAKGKRGGKDKARAKGKRGGKGKRGDKGKAFAKGKRGDKGKANAGRGNRGAPIAG